MSAVVEIALIVAAAWLAVTLIVLAICRAATRNDKSEDDDRKAPRVGPL